jgi:hypothetical protein
MSEPILLEVKNILERGETISSRLVVELDYFKRVETAQHQVVKLFFLC